MYRATVGMAIAGGAASVGFTIWAGRRNPSWLLIAIFVVWVSLPFAALCLAAVASRRGTLQARAMLCAVTLIVTICSLLIYGHYALTAEVRTRAFVFLVVPPVSAAVVAALLLLSWRSGRAPT